MKKFIKMISLIIFCTAALGGYAFADVAVLPMVATIGLIYVLVAAVAIVAIVLIIKLLRGIIRNREK